jgi:hypothetical protein
VSEPRIVPEVEARALAGSRYGDGAFNDLAHTAAVLGEQRKAVLRLTYASDDGTEYEHEHDPFDGFPECPACWVADIRRALGVTDA